MLMATEAQTQSTDETCFFLFNTRKKNTSELPETFAQSWRERVREAPLVDTQFGDPRTMSATSRWSRGCEYEWGSECE